MDGSSATSPVRFRGAEQAGLLATKLHVPRAQPGTVLRERLVSRLVEARRRRLVLVCAPAGSGKTVLLADWLDRVGRPAAWLTVDAADNDPARFWRHVVCALDRVRPGLAERLEPLLGPPAPASFDTVVIALINELAEPADAEDVLLVLDDCHLIESPQVHASLAFLVARQPPGMQLVLAGRSDPPLALARMRLRGELAEVRAADLRFTAAEAAAMVRDAAEADLPDGVVAGLTARTEGWAAGLRLAALSLRGHPDAAGFVATFSGSHRSILDYLSEEVLERQPAQVRRFLLETSVLDRLSGPLCDAVTGQPGGQEMLESIERADLFLVPLDDVRAWWRYHHLFADLLRTRLHQRQPARAAQLHRHAAGWHEQHGAAEDAVRHALAAGDPEWAARLIERHVDGLLLRSAGVTVRRWLAALPAELVERRPRLLLARARLTLLSGRIDGVEPLLDAAERASAEADVAREAYQPSVGRAASLLVNVPATIALDRAYLAELRGDADGAIRFATRAVAEIRDGEWMLQSHAGGYLALAEWLRGRMPEAERALLSSAARWRSAGEPHLALRGYHHLGELQRAQGRLDAAVRTYRRAIDMAAESGSPALPGVGIAYLGLAQVAYERSDLDAARRYVEQGLAPSRQLIYRQPLATGLATLAWIRQADGDPGGAREAMAEAARVASGHGVTTLLDPVPAQQARLLLAQGDVAAAADWAMEHGLSEDDEPGYPREPAYLLLARVLLAQDRPDRALTLVERMHEAAVTQGRTGSVIELRSLRALALAARGDEADAVATMAAVLTLACPQGYVRTFADEGAPMAALIRLLVAARLAEWAADDVPLDCLARLLRAFPATGTARRGTAVPGLIEQLTTREAEVLVLLAAGRSNRRIAEQLVVTLDTVKKHVGRVLDKLGAANRTEAVARAHALDLIP